MNKRAPPEPATKSKISERDIPESLLQEIKTSAVEEVLKALQNKERKAELVLQRRSSQSASFQRDILCYESDTELPRECNRRIGAIKLCL